ncbi:MAG: hypothetical protein QW292_08710 [Candidatus Parvarchaeota archaeon]
MGNKEYVKVVFGSKDIYSVFGKCRKPDKRKGMTRKEIHKNAETGWEIICSGKLNDNPYNNILSISDQI